MFINGGAPLNVLKLNVFVIFYNRLYCLLIRRFSVARLHTGDSLGLRCTHNYAFVSQMLHCIAVVKLSHVNLVYVL